MLQVVKIDLMLGCFRKSPAEPGFNTGDVAKHDSLYMKSALSACSF